MPGGDFHPWLFFFLAAWILICGLGVKGYELALEAILTDISK